MKKVCIVTIYDNNNFGNRLQNYAVQSILRNNEVDAISLKYDRVYETKLKYRFRNFLKILKSVILKNYKIKKIRLFKKFNKNITFTKNTYNCNNISKISKENIDKFIVGSDQVWNPNFGRLTDIELLNFTDKPKIAFSASFGVSNLSNECVKNIVEPLSRFKAISVREDAGKKIIDEMKIDKSVEVLVDPTMLLSADEWDKVSNMPKNMKKGEKYILNYFLGELPVEWDKEIKRIARENDCKIINILSEKNLYFVSGPAEFLYLEKNAFLVCTDSFHSSVFSIIYDTPFVVFNREDEYVSMNSRLDTLLSKFGLENRKFNGSISDDLLRCDYSNARKILEKEKEKSKKFLCKALDINE